MTRLARALAPVAAALLLWALFLPAADRATDRLVIDPRLPALVLVLCAGLGGMALFGRRLTRRERGALALLVVAAAALQLASAVVLATLDRPLDLYFDLRHVPSLLGLFVQATGAWPAAGWFALALAAAPALVAAAAWAVGTVQRALAGRGGVLAAAALVLLAGCALLRGSAFEPLSFAATDAVADQGRRLARAAAVTLGLDHRYDAALAAPQPAGDLAALAGRDVYLVFVESYGTAVLDEPAYRAKIAPALTEFAAAASRAGYGMVSSRLVSPVFGAGSWLAHGTLASGVKLDPFLDTLMVESGRKTLGRYFAAAGHRTVAVMPGIQKPWPEASFWGFEHTLFAKDLGYGGPEFGWFAIPDQYTLQRFAEREGAPGHAPLFAEIVLVSSHTPFAPVPPYVAPWRDGDPYAGIPQAQWRAIYRAPDWSRLDRPYLDSVVYDLQALAGWLLSQSGNGLVIILGDHQPPGLVSGASAPWTVPIHVLSRDPALLAPFRRQGYVEGPLPPRNGTVKGMESFLGDFVGAFSTPGSGSG